MKNTKQTKSVLNGYCCKACKANVISRKCKVSRLVQQEKLATMTIEKDFPRLNQQSALIHHSEEVQFYGFANEIILKSHKICNEAGTFWLCNRQDV